MTWYEMCKLHMHKHLQEPIIAYTILGIPNITLVPLRARRAVVVVTDLTLLSPALSNKPAAPRVNSPAFAAI